MKLKIKKLYDQAILPSYAHEGDAGMDLFSAHDYVLAPGDRTLVETGISVEVPEGYELQIRPRSGLALKHGLSIVNSPGTVDSSYRGEVGVICINLGNEPIKIEKGKKVAQMVFKKIETVKFEEVPQLDDTSRGEGGFG